MVVALGVKEMEVVVSPLLHTYVVPPDAVSVVASPMQSKVFPEITGAVAWFTVTVAEAVSAQTPFDAITEYVVFVLGETVMTDVVAVVFQE